jgi:hypothetical protein
MTTLEHLQRRLCEVPHRSLPVSSGDIPWSDYHSIAMGLPKLLGEVLGERVSVVGGA